MVSPPPIVEHIPGNLQTLSKTEFWIRYWLYQRGKRMKTLKNDEDRYFPRYLERDK